MVYSEEHGALDRWLNLKKTLLSAAVSTMVSNKIHLLLDAWIVCVKLGDDTC